MQTYLVLNKKLDTLNGSSSSLRDGSGDTTHCYAVSTVHLPGQQVMELEFASLILSCDGGAASRVKVRNILKKSTTKAYERKTLASQAHDVCGKMHCWMRYFPTPADDDKTPVNQSRDRLATASMNITLEIMAMRYR